MHPPRGEASSKSEQERQTSIWSYFDGYKTPGVGKAVARPDFQSFHHISDTSKERDGALLKTKKNKPNLREQRTDGPDAFAFENFLTTEAKRLNWFGGELTPTTEYDDWVCGADAVVEWPSPNEDHSLRLAIDFTSTNRMETFFRKSDKLFGNVLVKYLRSAIEREGGLPKEMRASMPLVLLGFNDDVFRFLAEQKEPIDSQHPLRRLLLEQAAAQIDFQLTESAQTKMRGRKQKIERRHHDLSRLKQRIDTELEQARLIPLDDTWRHLIKTSLTHQVLSGR